MSNEVKTAAKGLTTKKIILIFGCLVIVCAAVIAAVLLLRKPDTNAVMAMPVVDQNNVSQISEQVSQKVADGMFETHMNTNWKFPNGKSPSSNAVMGNSASNKYPFWFTVTLKDTKEVVYKSSVLPLGSQIKEVKLDKNLKKGSYDALVTVNMVKDDGTAVDSNMGFNVTLTVEN